MLCCTRIKNEERPSEPKNMLFVQSRCEAMFGILVKTSQVWGFLLYGNICEPHNHWRHHCYVGSRGVAYPPVWNRVSIGRLSMKCTAAVPLPLSISMYYRCTDRSQDSEDRTSKFHYPVSPRNSLSGNTLVPLEASNPTSHSSCRSTVFHRNNFKGHGRIFKGGQGLVSSTM